MPIGLNDVPSDQKKWIDQALHAYLPKKKTLRTLYSEESLDSAQTTNIYGRLIQSYSVAKGYYAMDDPVPLADGARPTIQGMGTEDATSTQKTWSEAYMLERKLLKSGLPFQKAMCARAAVERLAGTGFRGKGEGAGAGGLVPDRNQRARPPGRTPPGRRAAGGEVLPDPQYAAESGVD